MAYLYSKRALSLGIRIALFAAFLFFAFLTHHYKEYQTDLSPGVFIMEGPSVLKANQWSVPVVYDWNSDGKKDLLVGNRGTGDEARSSGFVYFYKNVGEDQSPYFTEPEVMNACADSCVSLNVAADG